MSWKQKKQNNPIPIQTKQNIRGYTASSTCGNIPKQNSQYTVYPVFQLHRMLLHPTPPHPIRCIASTTFSSSTNVITPHLCSLSIYTPSTNRPPTAENRCVYRIRCAWGLFWPKKLYVTRPTHSCRTTPPQIPFVFSSKMRFGVNVILQVKFLSAAANRSRIPHLFPRKTCLAATLPEFSCFLK